MINELKGDVTEEESRVIACLAMQTMGESLDNENSIRLTSLATGLKPERINELCQSLLEKGFLQPGVSDSAEGG